MARIDDFYTQIGSATKIGTPNENVTFVRVMHMPTGKERSVCGLGDESALQAEERLIREIKMKLENEALHRGPVNGSSE